jgi:hypothetical protein
LAESVLFMRYVLGRHFASVLQVIFVEVSDECFMVRVVGSAGAHTHKPTPDDGRR